MSEPISRIVAIKRYFESDGGRKVEMSELKALTAEDKVELGALAAAELGITLKLK